MQYFKLKQRKKKWGAGKPRDVVDGEDDKDSDYELIFKGEFSLRHAAVSIFSRDFADLDPQAATGTQQHDEDFALTVHAPNQSLVIHAPSHDTLLRWATAIREAISTENGGTFHLAHSIRMLRYSMRSKQVRVLIISIPTVLCTQLTAPITLCFHHFSVLYCVLRLHCRVVTCQTACYPMTLKSYDERIWHVPN